MMKKLRFIQSMLMLAVTVGVSAASLSVNSVKVENIGVNKRMIRLTDAGLLVGNAGMCVEVLVDIKATGLAGRRVVCSVAPLDEDGNMYGDSQGEAASTVAVTVPNANYSGRLMLPLPYQWVMNQTSQKLESLKLGVTLACVGPEKIIEEKEVNLTENDIRIDHSKLGGKFMSDIFGGGSGGGLMGGLLGGLFDTSDAESTQTCPVCDGTGVCPHCDGDAFFDPKVCRKCANDPGICRRCKGEGTVTIKIDIY